MPRIQKQLLAILARLSAATIVFWIIHTVVNHSIEFWYLPWYLGLAWIPVIFSSLLLSKNHPAWRQVLLGGVWIAFLPNTFYVITDMIHINDEIRLDQTFDVVLLALVMASSFLLGLVSLWQIDQHYWQKLQQRRHTSYIAAVTTVCGGAIYIGRELRWNSWDVIAHPMRLIQDLLATISSIPSLTSLMIITVSFSVCIALGYYVFASFLALRSSASR